jgi:hypothetical protein
VRQPQFVDEVHDFLQGRLDYRLTAPAAANPNTALATALIVAFRRRDVELISNLRAWMRYRTPRLPLSEWFSGINSLSFRTPTTMLVGKDTR